MRPVKFGPLLCSVFLHVRNNIFKYCLFSESNLIKHILDQSIVFIFYQFNDVLFELEYKVWVRIYCGCTASVMKWHNAWRQPSFTSEGGGKYFFHYRLIGPGCWWGFIIDTFNFFILFTISHCLLSMPILNFN